jgi:hypothetical protein
MAWSTATADPKSPPTSGTSPLSGPPLEPSVPVVTGLWSSGGDSSCGSNTALLVGFLGSDGGSSFTSNNQVISSLGVVPFLRVEFDVFVALYWYWYPFFKIIIMGSNYVLSLKFHNLAPIVYFIYV